MPTIYVALFTSGTTACNDNVPLWLGLDALQIMKDDNNDNSVRPTPSIYTALPTGRVIALSHLLHSSRRILSHPVLE